MPNARQKFGYSIFFAQSNMSNSEICYQTMVENNKKCLGISLITKPILHKHTMWVSRAAHFNGGNCLWLKMLSCFLWPNRCMLHLGFVMKIVGDFNWTQLRSKPSNQNVSATQLKMTFVWLSIILCTIQFDSTTEKWSIVAKSTTHTHRLH